ncbi:MAG: bifunctional D-glycero-beta-D-manno-heptose-7-phosphate kinase/D-glycero-beta-D-manno-heptose 1-phosphate adenylyltransferase HldE [Halioglobus sp.]
MPRFDQAKVLVVGDIMLDRYWHGGTSRISPEAPVPVVKVEQINDRPGGAGNVALNVAALGAASTLSGMTGDDEMADSLQAMLHAAGVQCSFTRSASQPTITKLRVISRHQQLIRLDFEDPDLSGESAAYLSEASQYLADCGAVVLSDYAKGALNNPQVLIQAAINAQVPVLVDPKGSDFERYRGATLLTPNLIEFEAVVGDCPTEHDLVEKAEKLMQSLSLGGLLITRGEHGMTLLRPGSEELHLPARAREVFDVTGAGDTVIAVLAAALASGADIAEAVGLANVAASIVVGKLGTASVAAPELRRAVLAEQGSERGVVTLEQLEIAVADARSDGERIVFTNGCFDILHAGHVTYLEQARARGDRLIVAVNSDASVRELKGTGRPINSVDRRMAVLAGLESVDWVVCFEEDTPRALLERLRPETLVKGGDYDKRGVVGWEIVEGYGGEVSVLSFVDNVSTTAIVDQIQRGSEPV